MISAVWVLLFLPTLGAVAAYALQRWRWVESLIAFLICVVCAVAAATPINLFVVSIQWSLPVNVLGRTLALHNYDHHMLALLFSSAAIVFAAAAQIKDNRNFVALGLLLVSIVAGALMVRPFVISILLFQIAAAIAAILIQGDQTNYEHAKSTMRYLIANTLALPAFLVGSYFVDQAQSLADITLQTEAYQPAAFAFVIGFVLLFGGILFYTWLHLLANHGSPFIVALFMTVMVGGATMLFLQFKQEMTWLRDADANTWLKSAGILLMIVVAMIAWAQSALARVVASALLIEVGSAMVLLALPTAVAVEAVTLAIISRAFSLSVLALGWQKINSQQASANHSPLVTLIGSLSLVGAPGTLGFLAVWLRAQAVGADFELLGVLILAHISIAIGFARVLVVRDTLQTAPNETTFAFNGASLFMWILCGLIIWFGVAPSLFVNLAHNVAMALTIYP